MNKSTRVLLLLAAIALAVAPLRTVFPHPVQDASEGTMHCMLLQDGGHVMHHTTGGHVSDTDADRHGCDRCCQGRGCDGACGVCTHIAFALPASPISDPQRCGGFLNVTEPPRQTGRTLHPLLRPPILLPS